MVVMGSLHDVLRLKETVEEGDRTTWVTLRGRLCWVEFVGEEFEHILTWLKESWG
jgi:hypothetical protein